MIKSNKIDIRLEEFCILANLPPPTFLLFLTTTPIIADP